MWKNVCGNINVVKTQLEKKPKKCRPKKEEEEKKKRICVPMFGIKEMCRG